MTKRHAARPPRPTRGVLLYVAATFLAAVVAVTTSWILVGPPGDAVAVITMLVLGLLSSVVRERDVGSNITFSFLSIIIISSAVLIGPVGSALVGAISMAFATAAETA